MDDAELNNRFNGIDARVTSLEDLIRAEEAATRRHFDVVAEGLSGQIKLLAEGYDALRTDVTDLKDGQQRREPGVGRLELRMLSLESRQTKLERTQKVVLTEVRLLADSSRVRRTPRRT